MRGLLIKDLRFMLQQKRFFAVLLLLSVVLNFGSDGTFVVSYLTFFSSFFVLSTIGSDEQDNGYPFLMTLPVMRKTYVIAKYVFALLFGGVAWLLAVAISFGYKVANHSQLLVADYAREAFMILPIFILVLAIMLPFQFKYGTEKGRIVLAFVLGVCILLVFVIGKSLERQGKDLGQMLDSFITLHAGLVEILSFGVAIVAIVISCVASCQIMDRKEF